MKDKTKEQLIAEIELLRKEVAELEQEKAERKWAEEGIKAKSHFLESLIEQSPLPTFVIDSEGICVMLNKAFLKAYNVPKKEMVLGRNALTEPANVRQGVVKYIKEALSGKIVETPEIEFISPYEKKRTVTKSKLFPIFDATNKLRNVVVIHEDITARKRAEEALRKAYDELEMRVEERTAELAKANEELWIEITERKRAEEALQESEKKYRTTFENTGTAMAIIEEDTTISLVNHQFEILTGYSKEEIEGKKGWTEFVHEEDLERMKEYHRKRRESGGKAPTEYEFRFVDREGNIKNIFLTVEVIPGTKKSITSLMDITEHKRAEETLRESEGKYRDLADLLPQTVFEMDGRGNLTFANRSAFAIFGYAQNDFDRGLNALQMFIPEDRDRAEENIQKVLSGEGKTGNEYTAQKKDGGTFPCIIYSSPIIHENKPVGLRGIIVDITERKKAEERLEHSFIDLAETVSRAMGFRDPYTSSHQRRVAELARLAGEKIGLDEDKLRGLYIGGLLHDIGKISTPESILSKPGELTDEEWNLVRAHAKQGYLILKGTNLPWPVADMALHHHERLDGSDYPHGISGDEISLENRILGVCDVVEAMSSHRPYRPARSVAEILKEIKGGRGTKYDVDVVDIMLEMIESGKLELFSQT